MANKASANTRLSDVVLIRWVYVAPSLASGTPVTIIAPKMATRAGIMNDPPNP